MDIHRVRFVPYPTSAINALAFSHSTLAEATADDLTSLRLAVGRANGDLEIWNPSAKVWVQEVVFHGGRCRSMEALAWIQNPAVHVDGKTIPGALRLFSIGYSNTITEWNLEAGLPLRHWAGNHSEVWCMAAQPRLATTEKSTSAQNIVAGCADGSLVLLSTADNDFSFQRFLSRPTTKRVRILSLTFQNRHTVVAGYADSTIKLFDINKGTMIRNITLGAAPKGGPKDILVWSVRCLANGDIVSGDSTGEVRFFERKHYSQVSRIASHDADILDLAVSKETNTVFSTGMDRRTASYVSRSANSQWVKLGHESYHQHDVKVMSTYEGQNMSILASGGLDTNLVVLPMRNYKKEHHYTISGLPQHPPVDYCSSKSLVTCWWERELSIWRITKSIGNQSHRLMTRISLKGEENISQASINSSGSLLAVSTSAELKIFSLLSNEILGRETISVQKLISTKELSGRLVQFSPDGQWLVVITHSNDVCILDVARVIDDESVSTFKKLRRVRRTNFTSSSSLQGYKSTINRIAFSPDSRALVISDLHGHLDSWILQDLLALKPTNGQSAHDSSSSSSEDSDKDSNTSVPCAAWKLNPASQKLPKVESPALILSFRNSWAGSQPQTQDLTAYTLFVLTSQHNLWEFDLKSGSLTDWSRRNPTSSLPEDFRMLKSRAKGSFWGFNGYWWIYGTNWLFGLDTTVDHTGERSKKHPNLISSDHPKKRKRGADGAGDKIKRSELPGMVAPEGFDENAQVQVTASEERMDMDSEDESGITLVEGIREGQIINRGGEGKATWFLTHKYTPIVGIVPLKTGDNVEVVLIERPIWDLDLPPRFQKIHDR